MLFCLGSGCWLPARLLYHRLLHQRISVEHIMHLVLLMMAERRRWLTSVGNTADRATTTRWIEMVQSRWPAGGAFCECNLGLDEAGWSSWNLNYLRMLELFWRYEYEYVIMFRGDFRQIAPDDGHITRICKISNFITNRKVFLGYLNTYNL